MDSPGARIVVFVCVMVALFGVAFSAQSCNVLLTSNRQFTACQTIPEVGANLAWRIRNDSSNAIDFAYSGTAPSASGWVGWGINPAGAGMVGTQALIAFQSTTGAVVYQYPVTGAVKGGQSLIPGDLTLNFTDTSAVVSGAEMTIFSTLNLKAGDSISMQYVWGQGRTVDLTNNAVGPHSIPISGDAAVTNIDLLTAQASTVELPNQKLKNNHGLISAVSWGLLMPLGVMAARYLRPISGSNPAWFYTHIAFQCTGYVLGVVSWALGLKLHNLNEGGAVPYKHRNIGISIFALATLQVLALLLRPKPDAKYRKYWNIYHHTVGYATIILIIINIFEGLDLLQPEDKWTTAYVIVLCVLGGISLIMEIVIWTLWVKQRTKNNKDGMHGSQMKGTGSYRTGQDVV